MSEILQIKDLQSGQKKIKAYIYLGKSLLKSLSMDINKLMPSYTF